MLKICTLFCLVNIKKHSCFVFYLTELINMKTAEKQSDNRTSLSQMGFIVSSFDKYWFRQEIKQRLHLYMGMMQNCRLRLQYGFLNLMHCHINICMFFLICGDWSFGLLLLISVVYYQFVYTISMFVYNQRLQQLQQLDVYLFRSF